MKRRYPRPQKTKCPICSRQTCVVRYYRDGTRLYVHNVKTGWSGFVEFDDACFYNPPFDGDVS